MGKLSLEGLQMLDAIIRRGSFAAAAEELFRVPSTVSYAVHKLEEDLGVQLFWRNRHRPHLTPAGEALLKEGRLILQAAADVEARGKRVSEGYEASLSIALDGSLPCAPVLELMHDFYADGEHSETAVRVAHDGGTALDNLAAQRTDLALGPMRDNVLKDTRRRTRLVGVLEIILAVSPDHPLARYRGAVPAELLRKHRVAVMAGIQNRGARRAADVTIGQKNVALPTLHAKITALKAGFAAGFLPRVVVSRELRSGDLVEVTLDCPPLHQNFYLGWDERPKGKAFQWWLERLDRPTLLEEWLRPPAAPQRQSEVSQLALRPV